MGEKLNPPIEYFKSPEYWDGHKIGDFCEQAESDQFEDQDSGSNVVYIADHLYKREVLAMDSKARKVLVDYLKSPGHIAGEMYSYGQIFHPDKYRQPQVVRYEKETVQVNEDTNEIEFSRKLFWGTLIPYRNKIRAVEFGNVAVEGGKTNLGESSLVNLNIQLGKANHIPEKYDERGFVEKERVQRINWLQTMKLGTPTEMLRSKTELPKWLQVTRSASRLA